MKISNHLAGIQDSCGHQLSCLIQVPAVVHPPAVVQLLNVDQLIFVSILVTVIQLIAPVQHTVVVLLLRFNLHAAFPLAAAVVFLYLHFIIQFPAQVQLQLASPTGTWLAPSSWPFGWATPKSNDTMELSKTSELPNNWELANTMKLAFAMHEVDQHQGIR